jgi:hypothetical protein
MNGFTRQTLPTINRKYFFMNIICIESFSHKKRTTNRCFSVEHFSSTVAILTTKISLWTCASTFATETKCRISFIFSFKVWILSLLLVRLTYATLLSRVWATIDEVSICRRFIEHLQDVTTSNYSAIANSHTLHFTIARTKSAASSPIVAW